MNRKRISVLAVSLSMVVAFTACKDSKEGTGAATSTAMQGNAADSEETGIQPATPEEAKDFELQKKMIEEFYANFVFGDKPYKADILHKYCTDRLIKKLKDDYDYEYDGGGYAIWEFRTGAQDGEGESCINDITEVAPNRLKVHFTDMGNESSHRITFINDGGEWRMDRID